MLSEKDLETAIGCDSTCSTPSLVQSHREVQANADRLADMLSRCMHDIHCWLQLAKRQQGELPDWEHLPCAPTTIGVNESRALLEAARVVYVEYRGSQKCQPEPDHCG